MTSSEIVQARSALARVPEAEAVGQVEEDALLLYERRQMREPRNLGIHNPPRCGRCNKFIKGYSCGSCGWLS